MTDLGEAGYFFQLTRLGSSNMFACRTNKGPAKRKVGQMLGKSMLGKSMPDKSMRPLIPLTRFQTFAEGLDHPEGLAFDAFGSLWARGELGQIYRLGPMDRVRGLSRTGGFFLGLPFTPTQALYV